MHLSFNPNVSKIEESATEVVDNAIKKMRRAGVNDIISLGVGEPYFDTPQVIKDATIKALNAGMTKYQPTQGDYELRKAISRKFLKDNHIDTDIENIIVTPGAKFAIFLALNALIQPGDKVMVLDPSWVSHAAIPQMMGASLISIDTLESEGFQPNIAKVISEIKKGVKCIILNSPNNPTGAVYPKETLRAIVSIAEMHKTLVISDEIYEDLIYQGEHYSPASEFENVITVNGFSKSFAMTGWRLGYVTGPRDIIGEMVKIYQHSVSCVTAFAQAGALEALTNPGCKQTTRSMVGQFNRNRQILMDFLDQSEFFSCPPTQGAFYCFPRYALKRKSLDLAQELLEVIHVATVPGSAFGQCGEYHLRLSYATAEKDLVEGIKRLSDYFKEQEKHR